MKNVIAYRLSQPTMNKDEWTALLEKHQFATIADGQQRSEGFVDPIYFDTMAIANAVASTAATVTDGETHSDDHVDAETTTTETIATHDRQFIRQCGDALVFGFRVDKKSVPSNIVKHELKKRSDLFTKEHGHNPGRIWTKEEKVRINDEMLPKVFPTTSTVRGYFDYRNGFLVIASASVKTAESIISALLKLKADVGISQIRTNASPSRCMTSWVCGEEPKEFSIDKDGLLVNPAGGKISIVKQDMAATEIQNHIGAGYFVSKLAMTWAGRVSFVLLESFQLQKMEWLAYKEDVRAEDKESEFAAQMTAESCDVAIILTALIEEFSGEVPKENK